MCSPYTFIQLFQLRLSTSKAEKSNTSAKGCRESLTNECIFKEIPSSLSRSRIRLFRFARGHVLGSYCHVMLKEAHDWTTNQRLKEMKFVGITNSYV